MAGGDIVGGGGTGNKVYIDWTGRADLSFHGIPLNIVKNALFRDKVSTFKNIWKLVVNGAVYDFSKSAKSGAVIYRYNYSLWDFIAPDDMIDFDALHSMTIRDALYNIYGTISYTPVPAWDQFFHWLNESVGIGGINTSGISSCYYRALPERSMTMEEAMADAVEGGIVDFSKMTDSVTFIRELIGMLGLGPLGTVSMSEIMPSYDRIGFMVICCYINSETGQEEPLLAMGFQIR
jgi:hypothetical protein